MVSNELRLSARTSSVKKILVFTLTLWKLTEKEPSKYLNKGKQIILTSFNCFSCSFYWHVFWICFHFVFIISFAINKSVKSAKNLVAINWLFPFVFFWWQINGKKQLITAMFLVSFWLTYRRESWFLVVKQHAHGLSLPALNMIEDFESKIKNKNWILI